MSEELRSLEVGQCVRFCSADRQWYNALVTAVHGEPHISKHRETGEELQVYPCVNLTHVSSDPDAQDQYGRQLIRENTSISHYGQYVASGFFWCHPEDEDDAYKKMCGALKEMKS